METIIDYLNFVSNNPFMWGVWAERLIYAIGLLLTVSTYKKTRIKGYLLIAAFFTLPYVSLISREVSHQINKEELIITAEQKNRELQRMMEQGQPIHIDHSINIPIFEALLVLGLFFVSKRQITSNETLSREN
ncbi:hypothetical protein MLD52_03975 [Puniceicoccaceae bacterium K14]|nr:hypothetical protein [Puniceicoccaceae bacterium K14]